MGNAGEVHIWRWWKKPQSASTKDDAWRSERWLSWCGKEIRTNVTCTRFTNVRLTTCRSCLQRLLVHVQEDVEASQAAAAALQVRLEELDRAVAEQARSERAHEREKQRAERP